MAKKQSIVNKILGRNKPEPAAIEFKPSKKEPEVEEFMEIGGSPVPGITLRQVLNGHTAPINRIAWSPDGRYLASPSVDHSIRIWDVTRGDCIKQLIDNEDSFFTIAWSPDSQNFASCSYNGMIKIWDIDSFDSFYLQKEGEPIYGLAWSPDGKMLASGDDKGKITIWNIKSGEILLQFTEQKDWICDVAWFPDGGLLASASGANDPKICIWNINKAKLDYTFTDHWNAVLQIVMGPKKLHFTSCSWDDTIKIWNIETAQSIRSLEGHANWINSISYSPQSIFLASKSRDNSVRIWRSDTWDRVATINESFHDNSLISSIAFHPHLPLLATLGIKDTVIRIWKVDYETLLGTTPTLESIRYTTAKLVLVGDSGVGKTGLGWRLAHNEFKEHSSTHGQQFWVVPELKKTREDGTECEAVLWDLAGQHIYRSIHSIFLDDVDASLILFDPTNRQEPLKGAQFWLEQLKGKKHLPPSVLVGARLDRGAPVLSQQELDQFCQKYGVTGGYIGTSAKSGEGVDKLLETLKAHIPWDRMTTTVTTVTFKRIKDYLQTLKEKTDRKGVLVKPDELRKQLQATDKDWEFTDAEMMTAAGHLANFGLITILKSSSGEEHILLVPELLPSVASSIFLHADKHPRELGAINETELLQGKYQIDEFKGLDQEEQNVLLDATVVRFLEHSLCFREALGNDNLLIFPSLIKQKRPLQDDVPSTDDISYIVRGRVENIYSSLVVLLGYTPSFTRINQWANQAQYETEDGDICGFRLVEDREGEIELILYYADVMEIEERKDFQSLFEQFLYKHDVEVTPFPPVVCPNGHRQERATVVKRLREGKKFVFCEECAAKVNLPDLETQSAFGFEAPDWLKREEALARLRNTYESHLVNVKGYRRDWAMPRCYISHADEQKEFTERLAQDLAGAGIFIVEEVTKVGPTDNIIIIDSLGYKKAWENNTLPSDIKLIRPRLSDSKHKGLIYIDLAGLITEHPLKSCVSKSFCDPTHYVINLFDLVLNLYAIPLSHAGFITLRQALHTQWEQTLAQKMKWEVIPDNDTPKGVVKKEVFVSYAWRGESESIVDEIDQAFQKRSIKIIRDKRDLNYKGSIKEFMERIGRGQAVVVVISDKYLKSKNCMFELMQIAENKQFKDRVFPVVLNDANIYESIKRIGYIKYWEDKTAELDAAIKTVSSANLQGIREEIDLFDKIRDEIAGLVEILQDMNTLTPEMHRDSNFQILYDAVMAKLEE